MPDAVLAESFGRVAIALDAGIDLRRAWRGEADRVPARWRDAMHAVATRVDAGSGLAQALRESVAFGTIVPALVEVGERTGREPEVLRDLAATLRDALQSRRNLVAGLVRPALQLVMALVVIGVLIVVSGSMRDLDGRAVDLVGVGLTGGLGLAIYAVLVALGAVAVAAALPRVMRSWREHGAVRRLAVRVPVLGPAVVAAEASAWCRTAALAGRAGLDPGGTVALAAAAAPGPGIEAADVVERLRAGDDLAAALGAAAKGAIPLPPVVLEAVAVGEQSGTTPETLDRLAGRLADESRAGFAAAVRMAGGLAWGGVALLATIVIWRFFTFYVGLITAAGRS